MTAVFLLSAGLQLNDPDPWAWVAIYLAAAGVSGLAATGRQPPWRRPAALAVALVALVWAIRVALSSPRLPPILALFGDWEMQAAGTEERRETLGLLFLSLWSAFVALPSPQSETAGRGAGSGDRGFRGRSVG